MPNSSAKRPTGTPLKKSHFSGGANLTTPKGLAALYNSLEDLAWKTADRALVANNYDATENPTQGDNASQGYREGSLWYNKITGEAFTRIRGRWQPLATAKHNLSAQTPPSPSNGSGQGYARGSCWCDQSTSEMYMLMNPAQGLAEWKRITTRDYDTFRFSVAGTVATGTKLAGSWMAPFPGKITKVSVVRDSTAGTGGSTIVDVNVNGTTIFTDQAKRPTIEFDHATGIAIVRPPDVAVVDFRKDVRFTMDVDQIDTGGSPSDLDVIVGVEYGGVY